MFPQDDAELTAILTQVTNNGCKLRVRGAGHSEDGLVMQKEENDDDIVVINLKDYKPPDDSGWNGALNTASIPPTIKISAGASLLEMISIIRPQGYLPTTSYPLPSFSVGGAYLNPSTHGATYGESRLAAQVVGMRVMKADGSTVEYDSGDPELKDWRGSAGMLGIVTAMEIRLRQDTGLRMTRDSLDLNGSFDSVAIRAFLQDKLTTKDGVEFFYAIHGDVITTYELDFDGDPSFDPTSTSSFYKQALAESPDLAFTGGGQEMFISQVLDVATGLATSNKVFASLVGSLSRTQTDSVFDDNVATVRDGFFVPPTDVPRVEILFYSVKCDDSAAIPCLDEIMKLLDHSRTFLLDVFENGPGDWYPHLLLEWRLFDVKADEMTLESLSPGTYLGWEKLSLLVDDDVLYSKYHKQLEDDWRAMYPGGGVHVGKAYAYGPVPGINGGGLEFPFQDESILDSVFSAATKSDFISKMNDHDPSGVFKAGSMLRLLGINDINYTPKQYNGDSCEAFGDAECLSDCCRTPIFSKDYCVAKSKNPDDSCVSDCECVVNTSGNPCRWFWFRKKCRD